MKRSESRACLLNFLVPGPVSSVTEAHLLLQRWDLRDPSFKGVEPVGELFELWIGWGL